MTLGKRGSAATSARSKRSHAIVSTPPGFEACPYARAAEPRHADDPFFGNSALGQPCQRGPHFAADTEDENVAFQMLKVVNQRLAWTRQQLFQAVFIRNVRRKGRWSE